MGVGGLSGSGSGKVIALVCVSFASCLVVGSVCKGGGVGKGI